MPARGQEPEGTKALDRDRPAMRRSPMGSRRPTLADRRKQAQCRSVGRRRALIANPFSGKRLSCDGSRGTPAGALPKGTRRRGKKATSAIPDGIHRVQCGTPTQLGQNGTNRRRHTPCAVAAVPPDNDELPLGPSKPLPLVAGELPRKTHSLSVCRGKASGWGPALAVASIPVSGRHGDRACYFAWRSGKGRILLAAMTESSSPTPGATRPK